MRYKLSCLLFVFIALITSCPKGSEHNIELAKDERLILSDKSVVGFSDESYVYIFKVDNELLLTKFVSSWELHAVDLPNENSVRPPSAYTANPSKSELWPSEGELNGFKSYYKIDAKQEKYWSVWFDGKSGKLYVEMGNW